VDLAAAGSAKAESGSLLGFAARLAATGLVYFVLAKAGLALASVNPAASPIWPPTGFALAAVLIWGIRMWPAILLAAFLANLTNVGTAASSLAIGAGNTLEAVVGGWLIARWSDGARTFDTPFGVTKFAAIEAALVTPISATIGLTSLALAGLAEPGSFWPIWLTWWLGDLAGALVITPLIVVWWAKGKQSFQSFRLRRTLLLVLATVVVGLVAFTPVLPEAPGRHALAFLCIFPLLWAAIYHGRRDTTLTAILLCGFAVSGAIMRGGSFSGAVGNDSFLLLAAFMISACLPSLVLAADVSVRKISERQLRKIQEGLHQRVERGTQELAVATAALHESQANYRLLVDNLHDYAVFLLDRDGNVVSWNTGAARIKGYSASEIIGQSFGRFYTEEERAGEVPRHALTMAALYGRHEVEGWRLRKDGSRFFAAVTTNAIRDDSGALVGYAKIVRDVTERNEARAALEAAREQLVQAQKMDAIGHLTGGVAHDFNNLLMIVSGHAQILRRKLSDAKILPSVDAIQTASRRGEALTRQLLAFARRQKLTPEVVDLRSSIQSVRSMLGSSLRDDIDLLIDIPENVWAVRVDESELELAVVNIMVNGRDAMPAGGTITLALRNVTLDGRASVEGLKGDFVALSVEDTGKGIPPEHLSKVFEPFFTTKETSKGTGLGLSQVYGFARQSDGAVTIQSVMGSGTTVTVYLPRTLEEPKQPTAEAPTVDERRAGTKVLIVEDNAEVMRTTVSLMEELGHEVVTASSADEALSRLYQGTPIKLVFSDIVMPGSMNGLNLAREIRRRFPHIPVVLATGYSDAADSAAAEFPTLRKPFDIAALDRALKASLGAAAAPPT
jgi:PAS domain S-box-containing protein